MLLLTLTSFDSLENWISESGLMINDSSNNNYGGVHSFYDEKTTEYGFIYPEITGYFLSCMRFLYSLSPNPKYLEKMETSGLWLQKLEKQYGGIIQGITANETKKLVYSFDTGICAKGLLDCYESNHNEEFLELAKKLVKWIIDESLENDGTIKPLKNLENNKFEEDENLWYKQKGCLHIKTSMPFFQLYKLTNDSLFLDKAILICNSFTKFQKSDGSLSLHTKDEIVHLHSLCYALEGLFYAYSFTKNNDYLECCKTTLEWCSKQIQNDNSIELWFNSSFQRSKASYAISQLIRMMILLDKISNSEKNYEYIKKLYSFLQTFQAKSNNHKINGGYYEEYFKSYLGWKKRSKLNSWGSMFTIQTLSWIQNYKVLQFENSVKFLY